MFKKINAIRFMSTEKGMLVEKRKLFQEGSDEYIDLTKKIFSLNIRIDNLVLEIKKEHTADTVSS